MQSETRHQWQDLEDEYIILQPIGTGSFGQVVKAQHIQSKRIVAIKMIDDLFSSPYTFKKVIREIQILRQLSKMKRNIFTTKLLDMIIPKTKDFSKIFLVMNYQTLDLKKLFRDQKPDEFSFTEDHFKVIFYNLLCSVNFLHSANILHRDLKPANILIDQDCNVILCDFGLARSVPEKKHKRSMTTHVASRWYRAPELILDK